MIKVHTYEIKKPLKLDPEFAFLFENRTTFKFKKYPNKVLRNCFVSNTGVLLKNYLIPLRSAENLVGSEDHTFYNLHWRKAIEQKIVCRFGKSLQLYTLDSSNLYYSIHTPWFGYFTWVTSYLPRLLEAVKEYPNAYLLYLEEWDTFPFVRDSIALFPNLKLQIIPKDHHVDVPNFLFIPCREWTSIFDLDTLNTIRTFFHANLDKKQRASSLPTKVYLSRGKSKRRKVINEISLEEILFRYGINTVYMEDLSFMDQVSLMNSANLVLSAHGAGLTNIHFMNEGATVIEMTPILKDFNDFRFPYWRMASLLGLNYYCLFCETNYTKHFDEYDSDLSVDLIKLISILDTIEKS